MPSSPTSSSGAAPGPFAGIRVIEIGALPAAAYCARLLADFGAEVIKVEPPDGDSGRRALPDIEIGAGQREGAHFACLNFNKQSVTTADGARLSALLAGADVLVEGMNDAERSESGIDHGALAHAYPHLVIADVSWFGASGPYRDFKGTDAVCRALAGLVKLVGPADGPALALPDYQAGIIGGLSVFIPVVAALMSRLDGKRGRCIEVSVHEAAVALSELDISRLAPGYEERRAGINLFTSGGTLGIFRCKQGWIGVTFNSPAQWRAFCNLLGMPRLGEDPNYSGSVARARRAAELEAMFGPRFKERTASEWLNDALQLKLPIAIVPDMAELLEQEVLRQRSKEQAMLQLQRAGVAAGAVLAPGELLADRHLVARGFWQTIERAYVGEHLQASAPFREHGAPYAVRSPAPTLGQHNNEVLGELLGLSREKLQRLAALDVIGTKALPPKQCGKAAAQASPA